MLTVFLHVLNCLTTWPLLVFSLQFQMLFSCQCAIGPSSIHVDVSIVIILTSYPCIFLQICSISLAKCLLVTSAIKIAPQGEFVATLTGSCYRLHIKVLQRK